MPNKNIIEKSQALLDVNQSLISVNGNRRFLKACDEFCASYLDTFKESPFFVHYMGEKIQFDISNLDINIKCQIDALPTGCNAAVEDDTQTILINSDFYLCNQNRKENNIRAELFYILPHEIVHCIQNYLIANKNEFQFSDIQADYIKQVELSRNENFKSIFFDESISLRICGIPLWSLSLQKLNNSFYTLGLIERDAFIYGSRVGDEILNALQISQGVKRVQISNEVETFCTHFKIDEESVFWYLDSAQKALISGELPRSYYIANIEYHNACFGLAKKRYNNGLMFEPYLLDDVNNAEFNLSKYGIVVSYPHKIDNDAVRRINIITDADRFNELTYQEQLDNVETVISALMSGSADPDCVYVWPQIKTYITVTDTNFAKIAFDYLNNAFSEYIIPNPIQNDEITML